MPKVIDHQVMREELLTRSLGLFAQRGFHAVTMRELARELGVSTGTLYHYFTSKTDLYGQMLRTLVMRDVGFVVGNISEAMSVQARLRLVVDYVVSHEEQFKDLIHLMFDFYRYSRTVSAESAEGKELAKTHGLFRDLLSLYREAIQQNAGVPLPGVAQVILSTLLGSLVQRILDPSEDTIEEAHACLESLLVGA